MGALKEETRSVVQDSAGIKIAVGLVNYSSLETDQIKGLHSDRIDDILDYNLGNEVIHHNNMLIL